MKILKRQAYYRRLTQDICEAGFCDISTTEPSYTAIGSIAKWQIASDG